MAEVLTGTPRFDRRSWLVPVWYEPPASSRTVRTATSTPSDVTPMPEIRKLLVANRGEIAIRVFRSAHELGIRTVAIYSHEDRFAMHRLKADEAYQVGKAGEPIRSYLNIPAIVALAREKGVDAIHPGYGFLSENAEFARACEAAGIIFVGPRPEMLDMLGDKVAARKIAAEAGVPILAGSPEPVMPGAEARALAEALGYPVIVKASMGGGGRGMRVVESAEGLDDALDQARREAGPRSAARRLPGEVHPQGQAHRGPAPRRPPRQPRPPVRARLLGPAAAPEGRRDRPGPEPRPRGPRGASATPPSRSAGRSATTTPGPSSSWWTPTPGQFFFIEVNPRIQVEHTVTEMVTGVDLVKSQILIAQGSPLSDPEINLPDQDVGPDPGLRLPVPDHHRGPREQVHARLRPDHPLPIRRRPRHPPRRRPGDHRRDHHAVL